MEKEKETQMLKTITLLHWKIPYIAKDFELPTKETYRLKTTYSSNRGKREQENMQKNKAFILLVLDQLKSPLEFLHDSLTPQQWPQL